MAKLIAMVATAVLIDGVRTVIKPGEELPDLPKHDQGELLASGAAKDQAAADKQAAAEEKFERAAQAAFERERNQVRQAQQSTATADGDAAAGAAKGNTPGKGNTAKRA